MGLWPRKGDPIDLYIIPSRLPLSSSPLVFSNTMKTTAFLLLSATSALAQNPPPSGGDPPFVPPAVTRAALMDIYSSTGGKNWKNSDGWGTDT